MEEEEGAGREVAAPPPAKLEEEEGAGREALRAPALANRRVAFQNPLSVAAKCRGARPVPPTPHLPPPPPAPPPAPPPLPPWRARRAGQLYEAALSEKFDKPPLHAPRYPHA